MTPPLDFSSLKPTEDVWHGFRRFHFIVEGRKCWVAVPKNPRPGHRWAWWMIFPDAFPERTGEQVLPGRGYYVAFMDVGNSFGAPSALAQLSAFYRVLTGLGLNAKPALVGISRGGLFTFNWAAQNPDKVSAIYNDAPVCSFASWPYENGAGREGKDWKELLAVYGFKNDREALDSPLQPLRELDAVARAGIPVIHVVGDADSVVPVAENTEPLEKEYLRLGGKIVVIHRPGCGHHPHGLDDPAPVIDFIIEHER